MPDHFRYRIPAPEKPGRNLLHLPYWRMKGLSFSVMKNEVRYRFIDTSALAMDIAGLPRSLGVRPQTRKLKFASPGMPGRYLEACLPSQVVIPTNEDPDPGEKTFHRTFIGETVSLVYAPAYLENGTLFDALLERPLGKHEAALSAWRDESAAAAAEVRSPNWQVRFIPTLCPNCGWDLQGEKDALVLTCNKCDSAWSCDGTALTDVPFVVLTAVEREVVYLPFWRMKPRADGIALNSYADLIRLANLPKVMNPDFESVPVYFWSPAFKVNPLLFLRWSRQMTVYQPQGKTTKTFAGAPCYPVTLACRKAVENMKITLAELVIEKRRIYPLLTGIRLAAEETLLVYHPFLVGSRELVHETMKVTLDRAALNYGVYL
jgi:hypothetical protein